MSLDTSKLEKRLGELSEFETKGIVGKCISFVQESAKAGCPANDGELREKIFTTTEVQDGVVRGICYTNVKHGPYVEFGTGPKGQANHEGISPNVSVAYSQSPWWMHESQIDKAVAEKYHFFSIETKDGIFYQTSGQAAQPFMYPALKNNVDTLMDIIGDEAKKVLK